MDPVTSWLLLLVVGVPWALGVHRIVVWLATCHRRPLQVSEDTRMRIVTQREAEQ